MRSGRRTGCRHLRSSRRRRRLRRRLRLRRRSSLNPAGKRPLWRTVPALLARVPGLRALDDRTVRIRLERARLSPSTDAEREARVAPYWNRYREAVTAKKPLHLNAAALADYRWMVEEYRVSVFAQELRTPTPVSPKRLDAFWSLIPVV